MALYDDASISCKALRYSDGYTLRKKLPDYLLVQLILGHSRILLGVVYGPHEGEYWSMLEEILFECNTAAEYTIIVGDFNIDWWEQDCCNRGL